MFKIFPHLHLSPKQLDFAMDLCLRQLNQLSAVHRRGLCCFIVPRAVPGTPQCWAGGHSGSGDLGNCHITGDLDDSEVLFPNTSLHSACTFFHPGL